jgi:hypothetical protein
VTALEFPYPPRQLFPNFKRSNHWSAYSRHAKNARMLGWGLTKEAMGPSWKEWCGHDKIPLRIQVAPPMRGGPVPDEDNMLGALKHYLDGMADGLKINDKRFKHGEIEWLAKKGPRRVRAE